jgi:glycerol-1-phosphate dehydrogenase [NAD(P)+]
MCEAPLDLMMSGFGDTLGKRTALADWVLSRRMTGEFFCERTASLMDESSMECVENLSGIISRDKKSVHLLTDALIIAGICMAFASDTRPASGGEHILSHFMVESALASGKSASHGITVAVGTLITTILYEYLLDELKPAEIEPNAGEIRKYLLPSNRVRKLLAAAGISARPEDHLSSGASLEEMIRLCASPGKRYTILRFLSDIGRLEDGIRHVINQAR